MLTYSRQKKRGPRALTIADIDEMLQLTSSDLQLIWAPIAHVVHPAHWNPHLSPRGEITRDYSDQMKQVTYSLVTKFFVAAYGVRTVKSLSVEIRLEHLEQTSNFDSTFPWPQLPPLSEMPQSPLAWLAIPEHFPLSSELHAWDKFDERMCHIGDLPRTGRKEEPTLLGENIPVEEMQTMIDSMDTSASTSNGVGENGAQNGNADDDSDAEAIYTSQENAGDVVLMPPIPDNSPLQNRLEGACVIANSDGHERELHSAEDPQEDYHDVDDYEGEHVQQNAEIQYVSELEEGDLVYEVDPPLPMEFGCESKLVTDDMMARMRLLAEGLSYEDLHTASAVLEEESGWDDITRCGLELSRMSGVGIANYAIELLRRSNERGEAVMVALEKRKDRNFNLIAEMEKVKQDSVENALIVKSLKSSWRVSSSTVSTMRHAEIAAAELNVRSSVLATTPVVNRGLNSIRGRIKAATATKQMGSGYQGTTGIGAKHSPPRPYDQQNGGSMNGQRATTGGHDFQAGLSRSTARSASFGSGQRHPAMPQAESSRAAGLRTPTRIPRSVSYTPVMTESPASGSTTGIEDAAMLDNLMT